MGPLFKASSTPLFIATRCLGNMAEMLEALAGDRSNMRISFGRSDDGATDIVKLTEC